MAANARAPSEQQQEKRKKFGERLLRKSRCLPENIVRIACGELAHHAAMQREGATLIEMTRKPHESEDTDADAHRLSRPPPPFVTKIVPRSLVGRVRAPTDARACPQTDRDLPIRSCGPLAV